MTPIFHSIKISKRRKIRGDVSKQRWAQLFSTSVPLFSPVSPLTYTEERWRGCNVKQCSSIADIESEMEQRSGGSHQPELGTLLSEFTASKFHGAPLAGIALVESFPPCLPPSPPPPLAPSSSPTLSTPCSRGKNFRGATV